ncbi:hypothetical protein ACHQM5_004646 [Ranunculus cassubicifolius]
MPSDSKKKKRKAAKKKKKKLLRNKTKHQNNNGSINIQGQNDLEIPLLDDDDDSTICNAYREECYDSCSCTQSDSSCNQSVVTMEGSSETTIPIVVENMKDEVIGVVKMAETEGSKIEIPVSTLEKKLSDGVSFWNAGTSKLSEKIESLKEKVTHSLMEEGKTVDVEAKATAAAVKEAVSEKVAYDPVEKVISVSEELGKFVEAGKLKIGEKLSGVVPVGNTKINNVVESVSKGIEDKMLSSLKAVNKGEASSHETGELKEVESSESSQTQQSRSVTFAPEAIQRATWKNCCGLFEALSSSNR